MKILFLQDDFPPQSFGGAGISTYELAIGMKRAGHDVYVVTTCRKESEAGEENYNGLKVFKIYSNYSPRWRAYISLYNKPVVRQVEELLKKIKPDVIHINNVHTYLSYYCFKLAKKYSKAVVFTARDTMSICYGKLETKKYLKNFNTRITLLDNLKRARKRWNPFRNLFIKKYLKYADKIFALSNSLKEALMRNGIKNVEVIYNGIDIDAWEVSKEKIVDFKKRNNLQGKKVLLFGGRLSASKGGGKVIEALAQIVKEEKDVVLLVLGIVDQYAQAMKEIAKDLGIDKNIIFTGWIERDEIKVMYSASDIVFMPSIYLEAFGRVNIEAMVSRKPVIASCYGGIPEIVVDGETGFVVNPIYPEQIAEKTLVLLKDSQKAKEFGEAGYLRVKKCFNLDEKIAKYIDEYKTLLLENKSK